MTSQQCEHSECRVTERIEGNTSIVTKGTPRLKTTFQSLVVDGEVGPQTERPFGSSPNGLNLFAPVKKLGGYFLHLPLGNSMQGVGEGVGVGDGGGAAVNNE